MWIQMNKDYYIKSIPWNIWAIIIFLKFLVYVKFKFNWIFNILSGNLLQTQKLYYWVNFLKKGQRNAYSNKYILWSLNFQKKYCKSSNDVIEFFRKLSVMMSRRRLNQVHWVLCARYHAKLHVHYLI